jgi:hypothetical protein
MAQAGDSFIDRSKYILSEFGIHRCMFIEPTIIIAASVFLSRSPPPAKLVAQHS